MARIYHHTNTMFLPWIVSSGVVLPTSYGPTGYVWATTCTVGEPTSQGLFPLEKGEDLNEPWCEGRVAAVRLTLDADGFVPWLEIKKTWTPEEVIQWSPWMEGSLVEPNSYKWWVRLGPLPIAKVLRIEARINGHPWTRIKATDCFALPTGDDDDDRAIMGTSIRGFHFYSRKYATGCYWIPDRDEIAAAYEDDDA
jgi:hypothetical protein